MERNGRQGKACVKQGEQGIWGKASIIRITPRQTIAGRECYKKYNYWPAKSFKY